jgi:hypothetical protein
MQQCCQQSMKNQCLICETKFWIQWTCISIHPDLKMVAVITSQDAYVFGAFYLDEIFNSWKRGAPCDQGSQCINRKSVMASFSQTRNKWRNLEECMYLVPVLALVICNLLWYECSMSLNGPWCWPTSILWNYTHDDQHAREDANMRHLPDIHICVEGAYDNAFLSFCCPIIWHLWLGKVIIYESRMAGCISASGAKGLRKQSTWH